MMTNFIKTMARHLGLEVRRFIPSSSAAAQFRTMLKSQKINLILDVGANTGQYGTELRGHVGYKGQSVSFEPMSLAHAALTKTAAKDNLWEVSPRAAIGAEHGEISINISHNSVSSSVLAILDSHINAEPKSRYKDSETVPLVTLDSAAMNFLRDDKNMFLKIDTQGYESQVLEGAKKTLEFASGVQLELSLVPLYEGQMLMLDLITKMKELGFDLWGLSPTFADPESGQMLQVDGTFFKRLGKNESD